MVCSSSINLLPRIIRQSFLFGGSPFKWDQNKQKMRVTRNIYCLTRWQISVFIACTFPFYLIYCCCYSWIMRRPLMEFNLSFYMLVAIMILSTMHLMVLLKTVEMASLINSALRYQKWFLRRYVDQFAREKFLEMSADKIENLPWKFYHMIHIFVCPLVLIFIMKPYYPIFPTSIMPPEMKNIVSILIFGFGLIYNSYGTLSLLSMIGAVFIYSLLIVRQMDSQLHLGVPSRKYRIWTFPKLRTVSNIILNHRCQSFLIRIFEDIFSTFAMPYITIVTRAVIFSIFMLVQYNKDMDAIMIAFTTACAILIPFAGFSILYFSASVQQSSKYVQGTWFHHDWHRKITSKQDRMLWKRFRRSCRYHGVQVGVYYKIRMQTAITMIHLIMSEASGLLLAVDSGQDAYIPL